MAKNNKNRIVDIFLILRVFKILKIFHPVAIFSPILIVQYLSFSHHPKWLSSAIVGLSHDNSDPPRKKSFQTCHWPTAKRVHVWVSVRKIKPHIRERAAGLRKSTKIISPPSLAHARVIKDNAIK